MYLLVLLDYIVTNTFKQKSSRPEIRIKLHWINKVFISKLQECDLSKTDAKRSSGVYNDRNVQLSGLPHVTVVIHSDANIQDRDNWTTTSVYKINEKSMENQNDYLE